MSAIAQLVQQAPAPVASPAVRAEEQRTAAAVAAGTVDALCVQELFKHYPRRKKRDANDSAASDPPLTSETFGAAASLLAGRIIAIKGLSLGVPRGQCFGLLGPNGAGKSSTVHTMCFTKWLCHLARDCCVKLFLIAFINSAVRGASALWVGGFPGERGDGQGQPRSRRLFPGGPLPQP